MADEERKKSFWETLTGIITALAALLAGVAAVIAALHGGDKERVPQPSPPPAQVKTPSGLEEAARVREAELKRKLAEAEQRAEEAERRAAAVEASRAKAEAEAAKAKELQGVTLQKQTDKVDLTHLQRGKQEGTTIGKYIDHGDGTITDTKTGLMWKRCSEGQSGVNCENGKAEEYTWNDAVRRFKNVEYAGYSDWRLPTIDELETLVYCSKGVKNQNSGQCNDKSESPTINQQAFPNTEASWFWSDSPYANFSDHAWLVYFNNGASYAGNRPSGNAVRLVRGGQ